MKEFDIKKYSSLQQERIFHISTDVKNFHHVMPEYFKSLSVISETETEKIVLEKISFLGLTVNVKTKHVIKTPDIHEVYILNGLTKGTVFIESYIKVDNGTLVLINVKLKISSVLNLFGLLEKYIAKKMNTVTEEFITAAEKYNNIHLNSKC